MNGVPISPLSNNRPPTNPEYSFKLKMNAVSAAGPDRVRIDWEVKDLATSFNDAQVNSTGWFDTTTDIGGQWAYIFEQHVIEFSAGPRKWRVRVVSEDPGLAESKWFHMTDNDLRESDLLTTGP